MGSTDLEIYKAAFRATKNPAIIADTNFVVRDVNEACVDFTDYRRDELVGDTPLKLFNQADVYEEMISVLARGEPWVGGFETTTKDGRLIHGRGSCVPMYVEDSLWGYAGFFTDLTERRQHEQSLRILNRVLRHNLRNDANVVLGHIDIVAEELDDDAVQRSLSTARRRVRSIVKYAETARNLDELLSERTTSSLFPVRIDDVLSRELRSVRERYPDAEFVAEFAADPAFVAADDAVGVALEAVFANAVEHNDSAVPRANVRLETEGSHATVAVEDNGPGVPEGERDLVFGREEVSPLHHGQGLDLFFVDHLMEKYGGGVWVEDGDDGALFKLRFRTADPADDGDE
ncbi:PAS domain S-box protein [Haladaptatus salinisoli]|uniref:PAS domain S-box protein n=1 Tax=Haladaptatus salinisoli TaxID=2884876 RepID=UPI001D0BD8C8|nr:PAS domain-containing sensor histidine kinase [Haladaptatus salinisoli]